MRKKATLWIGLLCTMIPAAAAAQASADVDPMDEAYADLDLLVSVGLVQKIITGQKPYSRVAFATFAREARSRLAEPDARQQKARFLEALERLEQRFAPELAGVCEEGGGEGACPARTAGTAGTLELRPRGAWLEATYADSPERAMRTSYRDADLIDGALNPLLQNNQGRLLVDGATTAIEASVDAVLGSAFAIQARPRVRMHNAREADAGADATLQQAFVRAAAGNLTVDVGRNFIELGQGRTGGTVLSRNPRGMEQARVASASPFRLPGPFRGWGLVEASATLGDMGSDREFPGAKFVLLEWTLKPVRYFEFGAGLLNVQGGEGAPAASFGERLRNVFITFYESGGDEPISEKLATVHGRITIPSVGWEVYLDLASTDVKLDGFDSFKSEAAWLVGTRMAGLGTQGRLDLWLEGRRTGVRPYTHHQFSSGLTLDRRVLGDPMGPLATGWQMGVDWNGAQQTLSVMGAWERYSGDDYCRCLSDGFVWDREADNPDEIRLRTMVTWTRSPAETPVRTILRLGHERVTRFNFTDRNRSNFMAQFRVGYVW
jgi:hypothetical protein